MLCATFHGMFAIAIWDQNHRRIGVGPRPDAGQKPLVYAYDRNRLLFASELKSLLEVPDVSRQLDPEAIDLYLTYQYVPHPNTIFRGIPKFPGHRVVFQDEQVRVGAYWALDFSREAVRRGVGRADARGDYCFGSVTDAGGRAPGCLLSGGVDSSLIVALMQQAGDGPVRTFSIGFPESDYDETRYARRVAGPTWGPITGNSSSHQVPWKYCPSWSGITTNHLPTARQFPRGICPRQTREHVTVALTGDGGDELFLGYDRYRAVDLATWFDRLPWPAGRLLGLIPWAKIPAWRRPSRAGAISLRFLEAVPRPAARRYLDWIAIFNEPRRADLIATSFSRHCRTTIRLNGSSRLTIIQRKGTL